MFWQTSRFNIDLQRPQVMGIVNVTPDSFSDGGRHDEANAALRHCEQLLKEGADMLDIGGESTRPGASPPSLAQEMARVLPVLRGALGLGVPLSVDTSRPELMAAALDLGVDIINDVRALRRPGALACVAAHPSCGICLMHMPPAEPDTMQQTLQPELDMPRTVADWLRQRLAEVCSAGVATERIVLDPGIGFGKTPGQNWALLQGQAELLALGQPLLVGWSRKATLGQLTGRSLAERLVPSVVAALAAAHRGARVLRVHDVAATVDALKVWSAAGLLPR